MRKATIPVWDFTRPAPSVEERLIYGDPQLMDRLSLDILRHLSRLTGRRPSDINGAAPVLASLARSYLLEQRAQGVNGTSIGSPSSGVSVDFLSYAADHLPAGYWPRTNGTLRVLIDGAIAMWREANPDAVPVPVVVGRGVV